MNTSTSTNNQHGEHTMTTSPSHAASHAAAPHARILKILKSGKSGFRRSTVGARRSLPLICVALALFFAQAANAATAAQLATTINGYTSGSGAGFTAAVSGNTVTVTGTKTSVTQRLILDIDAGVTVIWKATLSGALNESNQGTWIKIEKSGAGLLDVQSGGSITMSGTGDGGQVIYNQGPLTISGGTVSSTAPNGIAIWNTAGGTVNITSGTVSGASGTAIEDYGTINISGGEVKATTGVAVDGSTINISGGTVSATTGTAVYGGTTTVSGTAKITSANVTATQGTIRGSLQMTGGTVENTANNANARTINNGGTGTVTISGGTVSAMANGRSIHNTTTGTVIITGGTISNTGDNKYYNANAGGTIIEWTNPSVKTYTAFTSTNITKLPATATAQWLNKDGSGGIDYANGTTTGFAAISGVTVNKATLSPAPTFPTTSAINYNPSTTLASVALSGGTGAGTFAWKTPATVPAVGTSGYPVVFTPTDAANYSTVESNVSLTVNGGYAVSKTNSTYTITFGSGTFLTIQAAIDNIRTQANGAACTIQFGNGTAVLDIGGGTATTPSIIFDGAASPAWGAITLTGKLTSSHTTNNGIIRLNNGASITSTAELTATGGADEEENYGSLIYNNGTGTATISGGKVKVVANMTAVRNQSTGAVNISGSNTLVSGTNESVVYNAGTGTVTISGGTVSATTGIAVYNTNAGKITVSGTAIVTSANTNYGTIYLLGAITGTAERLAITGGTVENTGSGNAIYNGSTGAVSISGDGYVEAKSGMAVRNQGAGALTISGNGFASATTGTAVHNASTGTVTMSGTVEATSGTAINNASTGTVNISGKVYSTTGIAINNAGAGKITVSGTAVVTSRNTSATSGTIFVASSGTATDERLAITGGTVENTSSGNAVYNASTGAVGISGGKVTATTGYALNNAGTGAAALTGGFLFAHGTAITGVINGTYTTPSGNAAIVAWNKPASGTPSYTALTSTDLAANPGTAALWKFNTTAATSKGIGYTNGTNAGHFLIASGYNLSKATAATPTGLSATYGQTLANLALPIGWAWESAATTAVGSAGTRTHTAKYTPTDANNDNTLAGISVSVAVAKADHDMVGISFPSAELTYTGAAQSIYIAGTLPTGVSVAYTGNGQTAAGTYTVTATFTVADAANYNTPAPKTATLVINNKITHDMSGIAFAGKTVTYSGTAQSIQITGTLPTGVSVAYTGNGQTNAGEHAVTATFTVANTATHNIPAAMTAVLKIEKVKIAKPTVANASLAYTGAEQSAGIAANAAYTVANGSATNAGNYNSTAALKDKTNYEWADGTGIDLTLPWAIAKANYNMGGVSFPGASLTHTGNPQSIYISGELPEGVSVTYSGNGQTALGTYTVTASFATSNINYNTPADMTATLTINNKTTPDMSGITFAGKTVTYSGEAHSIYISGALPSGVSVAYTGNGQTNAGDHTVTATFAVADAAQYNIPAPMTAVLTIEKATPATPTGITATAGQTLASVTLPAGWAWVNSAASVGTAGAQTHKANYTPSDAANYNAVAGVDVSVAVAKAAGATVDAPALASKTHNSISIAAVAAPANGQIVNYAINTANAAPADATAWKTDLVFSSLAPETDYYIFARAAENASHNAGAAVSLQAKTNAAPAEASSSSSEDATPSSSSSDGSSSSSEVAPSSSSDGATPSFNPQIATGSISIRTASNAILLSNLPQGAKVEVYSLQGKRIYSAYPGNSQILRIQVQTKGVYVVKAGSQSVRVVVK